MLLATVESVEDALVYIRERKQVTREAVHQLQMQFPAAIELMLRTISEHDVQLIGPPGC